MIRVVAGILLRSDGRVLVTERLGDAPFSGYWEFPGGKVEPGESTAEALTRELDEELGIRLRQWRLFERLVHTYPDRAVSLEFCSVTDWTGVPTGRLGQSLRWLDAAELRSLQMMPADAPVVERLIASRRGDEPGSADT